MSTNSIDPSVLSSASGLWKNNVGGGSNQEVYATTFQTPSGDYTFIPSSIVNNGLTYNGNTYWFPTLQNKDFLNNFLQNASYVDLSQIPASGITSINNWGDWVNQRTGQSPTGYLVKGQSALIDSELKTAPTSQVGQITGLAADPSGNLVYKTSGGHGNMYINSDGLAHDPYTESSGGFLGGLLGDITQAFTDLGPVLPLVANAMVPGLGTAITLGMAVGSGNVGDAIKNLAISQAVGQTGLGSAVSGATDSQALGQLASGTATGLAQGKDLSSSLAGGALGAGTTALANEITSPTQQPDSGQSFSNNSAATDYTSGADYALHGTSPGLKATLDTSGNTDPTQGPVDYSLNPVGAGGLGLNMPTSPNLNGMGGGQGLTANVQGGELGASGFVPSGTIPTPDSSTSLSGNQVKSLLGASIGSAAGANTGTTANQTGNSTSPLDAVKWLDTKAQMLAPVQAPKNEGIKLEQLQQIYGQLDPELQNAFSARGIAPTGYADGGTACKNSSLWGALGDLAPKFQPTSPSMPPPAGRRRQPPALSQLKQLQNQISHIGAAGGMAKGGLPSKYHEAAPEGHNPEFVTGLTGYYACGGGTGQSDDIPAMLHDGDYVMDAEAVSALGDGSSKAGREVLEGFRKQIPHQDGAQGKPVPAKIADGEYVFPAAFVTALGGGDNKKGAEILNGLREKLRSHKRSAPIGKIPPKAKSPLDYIAGSKG